MLICFLGWSRIPYATCLAMDQSSWLWSTSQQRWGERQDFIPKFPWEKNSGHSFIESIKRAVFSPRLLFLLELFHPYSSDRTALLANKNFLICGFVFFPSVQVSSQRHHEQFVAVLTYCQQVRKEILDKHPQPLTFKRWSHFLSFQEISYFIVQIIQWFPIKNHFVNWISHHSASCLWNYGGYFLAIFNLLENFACLFVFL